MTKRAPYTFKGFTWTALGLFALVGGGYAYWNYHYIDREEYRKLLEKTNPVNRSSQDSPYQATQGRSDVQKELVFNRGESRLLIRMVSPKADMLLDHTADSNELVESMHPVKIYMQEELFYLLPDGTRSSSASGKEMQVLRYIEADEARYFYKSDRLTASGVKMTRFVLPGHDLVTSIKGLVPTMQAMAGSVDFNPKDSALNMVADRFHANFITEKMTLHSDEARYKNHDIEFLKNVVLDHDLGQIRTQKATMGSAGAEERAIELSERVDFFLRNGDKLQCDHAKIDPKSRVGYFFSGVTSPDVIYSEHNKIPENALAVTSKRMETHFSDVSSLSAAAPQSKIQEIRAEDEVKINYKGAFSAASDFLVWDLKTDHITLQGHVVCDEGSIGRLIAEHEVKITRRKEGDKAELQSIQTTGKSTLVREAEKQTIICLGEVYLDHLLKTMTLESPKNDEGVVAEGDQVHFKDPTGDIYADRVVIRYRLDQKKPVVETVKLQGQVRILNQPELTDNTAQPVQYALADEVELVPGNSEMTLTAYPSKRVLFYDKSRDLQVSAPVLKVKRDEVTKKDSVKGSGDVRFNFADQEFEELRRRFTFKQQEK